MVHVYTPCAPVFPSYSIGLWIGSLCFSTGEVAQCLSGIHPSPRMRLAAFSTYRLGETASNLDSPE